MVMVRRVSKKNKENLFLTKIIGKTNMYPKIYLKNKLNIDVTKRLNSKTELTKSDIYIDEHSQKILMFR